MTGISRIAVRFVLATVLTVLGAVAHAAALEIRSFVITVSDIDRAVAFYESALHCRRIADRVIESNELVRLTGVSNARVRRATLQLGDERIELEQYLPPGRVTGSINARSQDLSFQHIAIVVRDMKRAFAHLAKHSIGAISAAPQTLPESNQAAAGIKAFKFRDPDGHPLELLEFPPDKGNPKWHQRADDRLFLGIDHSAITVADTERASRFYRDVLGMRIAGQSLNHGPTQEALDGAPGAVVRVTGLRPGRARGPGLEFLHYLQPTDGRNVLAGTQASDIAYTRVVLEVADIVALLPRLVAHWAEIVSEGVVSGTPFGPGKSLMIRDADGHAVVLIQPDHE
jgi:catechol 2,3-dioxygenase-like lactoylglutathione lyase family enzyme